MARISIVRIGALHHVKVAGRLSARDLKGLERRCAIALQEKCIPLEFDLRNVTSVDEPALAYLERLRVRGARFVQHLRAPQAK